MAFYQVIKDGQIIGTRTSDRVYTHAVVFFSKVRVTYPNGERLVTPVPEYALKVRNFAGSYELAEKCGRSEVKRFAKTGTIDRFEIIPVTVLEKRVR